MKRSLVFALTLLNNWPHDLIADDWLTFGGNPQRNGWAREETALNKETAPRMKLLWSTKLDNNPKQMNGLTVPVVKESMLVPIKDSRGRIKAAMLDVVIIGGSSDRVFALNADNGQLLWQKDLPTVHSPSKKLPIGWICSQSLNATPVIESRSWDLNIAHAISSDGRLHSLNMANGKDVQAPAQFVAPFSRNWSLNFFQGWLFTTTSQPGCGGEDDKAGVFTINAEKPREVKRFRVTTSWGGGIWGRAGIAISENGMVFAETGDGEWRNPEDGKYTNAVVTLKSDNLSLVDYFKPSNEEYITRRDLDMSSVSPVIFQYGGMELVAASGKEGVIWLLDAKSLGGKDHRTPLWRSPRYSNDGPHFSGHGVWGSISTWKDSDERWLYLPTWGPVAKDAPKFQTNYGKVESGSIMAFKVITDEQTKKPALLPVWISRDMHVPEPPVIANGAVFALANGADVEQLTPDGKIKENRHLTPVSNAILYAFDAKTGQTLWSSGDAIDDWTHFSGLALSNGKVIISTRNGKVLAFGIDLKNQ